MVSKLLVAVLLAGSVLAANAAILVFKSPLVSARVDTEAPCTGVVKDLIGASKAPKELQWAAATVVYQGRELKACAAPYGNAVVIIDEEGDGGELPMADFHAVKEI